MNPWLVQFNALLQFVFKASSAGSFLYIQAGIALLCFLVTLRLSGWALHVGYATWPRTLLAGLLVIGLPVGLSLAFEILARPQLPAPLPAAWVLGAMIGILLLGVLLPLLSLLLKTGFFQLILMLGFGVFAALIAALLVLFVTGAIQRGAGDFNKAEQRRNAIDATLSDSPTTEAVKP
jgi:hypothetical protein